MFLYETIRMRPLGDDQTGSIYDTQVGLTATQQRLTTSFARTFEINDDEIIEIQPGIATAAEEVDEDYEVNTFFTSARIISILTYVLGALLLSGVGLFVLALFTTDVTASGDSEVAAAPIVAEGEEVVSEEIASEEVASEEVDLAEERESEPTIAPTSESEDEAAVGDTEAQAEDGTTTDADDGAASADEDAAAEAEEEVETTPNANETVINIPQVAFPSTVGSPISTELYPPSTEFAVDLRTSQFDESQSGWRLYQSANSVRDVLRYEDIIYAATNGGLTVWDTEEGVAEKITTYDGLGSNDINQLLVCNLPTPTLVIASENGISLFDLERERYRYLNVANRELISDEVVSVSCSESSSFPQLFVGYRSDGVTIHNLNNSSRDKLDRSDGLPTNTVNHLQLVDNQLWISHGIGLTIYDLESNESIIYSENANNIPSQVVNDIVLDQQGLVWMATAGGLMVGNKSGSWTLYTTENTNIPQGVGLSVDVNEDGKIWYGTGFGQICLFDLDSRQCETTYRHPSQDLAFTNQITSIYADETVVIYGHFSDGIKFAPISANQSPSGSDWQTLYLPNQFPNNEVTALAEANEAIWIGTQEGLFQAPIDDLSGENWVFFSRDNVEALENDTIISLTPDENGGIWVGTAKGAVYYNGSSWEDALLTNVQINAVAIDNENSVVWFGTESGIFSYDGRETTAQNNIPADNVVALSLDGDDLYVGTSSGKLGILRGGAYNQFDSNNSPLSPSPIAALAPQPDGSVLLGNGGDLFQLNDGRTLIRVPGPRGFFISNILTTPDQEFIVTTTSNGIFYSERNDWKQLPISEGLPSNRIVDALIDSTGSLWLAGESRNESGGGLARYIPFPETN
ncbi:MAG: two-component regulator propeller domain-containing protein [Chloroflexota bacterium]